MNNNSYLWLTLMLSGIFLTLFSIIYLFTRFESHYIESLQIGKDEVLFDVKIESLKNQNSDIKSEIEGLNLEVNELGRQMNGFLQDYRISKIYLDSLIIESDQNPEILDTLINYYNDGILQKTSMIDSVSKKYEEKSNKLLHNISLLEINSTDLEVVLLEKNVSDKIINFKIWALFFYIIIMIAMTSMGVAMAIWGFRNLKKSGTI